jgi:hypothetical protein
MEASQHSLLAACFTLHSINATLATVPQRAAGLWIPWHLVSQWIVTHKLTTHLVTEYPLEKRPVEGKWPAAPRGLASLKRSPHLINTYMCGREQKFWSWIPTGLETKNYCAGEGQKRCNRPSDRVSHELRVDSWSNELVVRQSLAGKDVSRREHCCNPLPSND